jgi:hypothetical protein
VRRRNRAWTAAGLAALALPAAIALRFATLPEDEARKYYYEDVLKPFFVRAGARYVANRYGSSSEGFPAAKDAKTFRVFIVGGSIAGRYGGTEPGSLGAGLKLALPSRKIEVLNCGMAGYESHREKALVREFLGYAPDAIVLLSGQNEGMGSPPISWWRLKLMDLIGGAKLAAGRPVRRVTQDEANAVFKVNLQEMAALTKAAGVPLVVVLPPLNYRDNPPPFNPPAKEPRFSAGWEAYRSGRCEAAAESWAGLTDATERSQASYFAARCWDARGAHAKARPLYEASFDDPNEWRAGPKRLELMREIALASGAAVADVDAVFRAKASPRLPGLDMFHDRVHWFDALNDLATGAVLASMRASPAFASLPWDDSGVGRARALIATGKPLPGQPPPQTLESESLSTLRQALASMRISRGAPSQETVIFLAALRKRHPAWFKDAETLARLAETKAGREPRTWGVDVGTVDRTLLERHLADLSAP